MSWDGIVGHEKNLNVLQGLLTADRIPHALLFVGPEGVGKQLVSSVFAQGILCKDEERRPCGNCPSCRAVMNHTHPDLLIVQAEGQNIKIDQIRQLQHQAGLAGHMGTRRICIIEDADRLNEQAGNSMLKLLEDPPADMVFILITAKPYVLLPTIVSRCSMLKFEPLSFAALTQALIARGYNEAEAAVAARLGGGRLGVALTLLLPEGFSLRDKALSLLVGLNTTNIQQILNQAMAIEACEQEEVLALLRYVLLILRDVLLYQKCGELTLVYNIDIPDRLIFFANKCDAGNIYKAMQEVQSAQRALQARANVRLTMEAMILKLVELVRGENLADSSRGSL